MRVFSIPFLVSILACCLLFISTTLGQTKSKTDTLSSAYTSKKTNIDKLIMLNSLGGRTSASVNQLFIEKKLAEIKNTLKTTPDSAFYFSALGNLNFSKSDNLNAKNHLKKSLALFKSCNNYYELVGELNTNLAFLYSNLGDKDSSLFYYRNAVTIFKKHNIKNQLPHAYQELATEEYIASHVEKAIESCYNSINSGIDNKNGYASVALSYRLLSKINRDQGTGLKYYFIDSAIVYAKKAKDDYSLMYTYFLLGEYYFNDQKPAKALEITTKLKSIHENNPNSKDLKIFYYEFMSRYYEEKNDFKNCIAYFTETIRLSKENIQYQGTIGWMYNNMGDVCLRTNKFDEALVYLDSAEAYGNRFNELHLIWYVYYNKVIAYQAKNDYKTALEYFWKYDTINNSILTKENGDKIVELQTKFDMVSKESQLKLLNKDNALNKENIEKQHQRILFLSIIVGVTLLLIVLVIFAYNIKRKANILLAKQKQEIIDKTEQLNQQAADIAMYKAQMNPHFLFNAINSVQQFVLEKQTSLALEYLSDLSKLMRSTLNFSDKEFISIKDELDYLQQYIRFEKLRCDNKFEFHIAVADDIDMENTCVLPMLIQPFIENGVKHGIIPKNGKGNIYLTFEKKTIENNEFLKITIADDGIGRDEAQTKKQNLVVKHQSKGMEITQNRILKLNEKHFSEAIQGIKIIDKFVEDKSAGTTIELFIPFIELF